MPPVRAPLHPARTWEGTLVATGKFAACMTHPLENATWHALSTYQSHLNEGSDSLKYFRGNVSPFLAMEQWQASDLDLLKHAVPANRSFAIKISQAITLPAELEVTLSLRIYQMICTGLKPVEDPAVAIRPLTYDDVPQMLDLTRLTRPGPFLERTIDMGRYFGIFHGEHLAAMAGERVRLPGYTELSAVCTHPHFAGRGYASILSTHVCILNLQEGITPILHVRKENENAIRVYRKLGFEIGREIHFTMFKKG